MEEVEKLATRPHEIHFMDITDFPVVVSKPPRVLPIPDGPTHQDVVNPLLDELSSANLRSVIEDLSWYTTRYYTSQTGLQAVNWLASQYRAYAAGRADITVTTFSHSWLQPSVIARINGNGPAAAELVIIGGHIDSTSSGSTAPGADDDASGSSTVLEVFRVLATSGFRPERSIEFHAYAAEEIGLRGSQDIAQNYLSQGREVVATLQLDMTGYVRAGTTRTIGVVTDFTTPALSTFVRSLVTEYLSTSWTNTQCGYACSDHASWYRAGYPSSFTFESIFSNSNPYIHTTNDLVTYLNFVHALEYAKLGLSFAVELSYSE